MNEGLMPSGPQILRFPKLSNESFHQTTIRIIKRDIYSSIIDHKFVLIKDQIIKSRLSIRDPLMGETSWWGLAHLWGLTSHLCQTTSMMACLEWLNDNEESLIVIIDHPHQYSGCHSPSINKVCIISPSPSSKSLMIIWDTWPEVMINTPYGQIWSDFNSLVPKKSSSHIPKLVPSRDSGFPFLRGCPIDYRGWKVRGRNE